MFIRLVLTAVIGVFSHSAICQELPAVQFYQNTAYQCGGIGSDQAKAFTEAAKLYPLSLHFGQQYGERVAFIADVQVVMRDEQDQTVLNITSDGPICLLDIDPGKYHIFATFEGHTLNKNIEVARLGQQVRFTWPDTEKETHK